MGCAAAGRFFLVFTPFPLLRHSLRRLTTSRVLFSHSFPLSLSLSSSPLNFSGRHNLHTQSAQSLRSQRSVAVENSQPWPEWLNFVDFVRSFCDSGGLNLEFEGLVADEVLPDDFVKVASGCLAFARDNPNLIWSLSRKDIEVIVENGSAFLFKDAADSTRRMKLFLGGGTSNVLDSDKPTTVDLMKFLLSYVRVTVISPEEKDKHNGGAVESSVRTLFSELLKLSGTSQKSILSGSAQKQFPESYGGAPSSFRRNIEMKRGDWICPTCSFMNFARNMKCLQCDKSRPKRQLTGGEWECPQCDFFNYGRNSVCLRCDCKKPGIDSLPSTNKFSTDFVSYKSENEQKGQSWFRKVSELENMPEMTGDFPEMIPMSKGVNKLVIGTRKEPFERRIETLRSNASLGDHKNIDSDDIEPVDSNNPSVKVTQGLDEILNNTHSLSDSLEYQYRKNSRSGLSEAQNGERIMNGTEKCRSSNVQEQCDPASVYQFGELGQVVSESEKSEDLASAISDENFPEVMPMHKGENRLVVSKKKDRSLSSTSYKRHIAMEGTKNHDYVPFVPFPPDYFAKKDKLPMEGLDSTDESTVKTSSSPASEEKREENFVDTKYEIQNSFDSQVNTDSSHGYSGSGYATQTNSNPSSPRPVENRNIRDSWNGRSLEGSAVKEPDPLDMSEEAKAERWFKRVAQIKDISELSQIPDEDFPSIMPMRKGVNRFVVSKRKTPLERRLTSSPYRRNPPVANTDPVKRDSDSN